MLSVIGPFRIFTEPIENNFYKCFQVIKKQAAICRSIPFHEVIQPSVSKRIHDFLLLSHSNLAQITDIHFSSKYKSIYLFFENNNHTIEEILAQISVLNEGTIACYLRQIIDALSYCHSNNFPHGNLNLQNICISECGSIKILNFLIEEAQNLNQILEYMPPEFFTGDEFDMKKADIWSLGICLYAMTCGHLPWSFEDETSNFQDELKQQICSGEIIYDEELMSAQEISIISQILIIDPEKRPTIEEIKKIEWSSDADVLEAIPKTEKSNTLTSLFDSIIDDIIELERD